MSNDPNHPKPPPYGPPPPYWQGQPFSGQPQPPSEVPPGPSSLTSQPPRKGRSLLWILLGLLVVLLLACGGSIFALVHFLAHNPATDVVNAYYTAITNQHYATAFGYLDPTMKTSDGQQLTSSLFTQAGQGIDTTKGTVSNYSITNTALNSNNGVNTAAFTVSVTRNGTAYDVHLQLQQEGNDWKIVSYDTI